MVLVAMSELVRFPRNDCLYLNLQRGNKTLVLGDSDQLILVLYQPGSPWDSQMQKYQAAKKMLYIEDSDDEDEDEPDTKRVKGNYASDTGSSSRHPQSIQIGGDWLYHLEHFTAFDSPSKAASGLIAMYEAISAYAIAQLSAGAAAIDHALFTLGGMTMQLIGDSPIYWDWVVDYAEAMINATASGLPMLYTATMTSAIYAETISISLSV